MQNFSQRNVQETHLHSSHSVSYSHALFYWAINHWPYCQLFIDNYYYSEPIKQFELHNEETYSTSFFRARARDVYIWLLTADSSCFTNSYACLISVNLWISLVGSNPSTEYSIVVQLSLDYPNTCMVSPPHPAGWNTQIPKWLSMSHVQKQMSRALINVL